jgi:hypothetical protein
MKSWVKGIEKIFSLSLPWDNYKCLTLVFMSRKNSTGLKFNSCANEHDLNGADEIEVGRKPYSFFLSSQVLLLIH